MEETLFCFSLDVSLYLFYWTFLCLYIGDEWFYGELRVPIEYQNWITFWKLMGHMGRRIWHQYFYVFQHKHKFTPTKLILLIFLFANCNRKWNKWSAYVLVWRRVKTKTHILQSSLAIKLVCTLSGIRYIGRYVCQPLSKPFFD